MKQNSLQKNHKKPVVKNMNQVDRPKAVIPTSENKKSGNWFLFLLKPYNLLFGLIAVIFLLWCKTSVPSYKWVYEDLLKGGCKFCNVVEKEIDKRTRNVSDIAQKKQISYDVKYEAKVGINYLFLKYIREKTPENAIILFPPSDILTKKTDYLTLGGEIVTKTWVSHFLYPRTVVYEREKGKNPFYEKADYIILLHGWGYDHLKYKPSQMTGVDVVPISLKK